MIRTLLWSFGILGSLLLLQTTLLGGLSIAGARIDLLWVVFIILATQNGSSISQGIGFVLGLAVDAVTLAPLGYHAFLFTLGGYLFGLGSGNVFFDPIVMPAFLMLLASVFQALVGFVLSAVFRLGDPLSTFFHLGFLFQTLLNVVLAPLVFWVYGWAREKFQDPRRGFGG